MQKAIAVIVEDVTNRRLIIGASAHLAIKPEELDPSQLERDKLLSYEILIADEPAARQILDVLRATPEEEDPYRPAVLAVIPAGFNINDKQVGATYDGVLPMPQLPDALAAQLSVALYSHRSFARRYESQIEELQLTRQIFGSVANGITIANAKEPDLPLQYVNPSFEALTGYTLEDVRGKNCRFLQRDERDQPGLTLLREAVRDGKHTVAIVRNYRKDGTPFWNELALSPVRSRDGKITHFIGVQTNVTERVEFEQALRESEKLAVTGRLAASIAHEINNPLESITNLTYLARRSASIDEIYQYLDTLDAELRRVKLITSQALRFSRQSSNPEIIHSKELLDSILYVQQARLQAANVEVIRRDRFQQSFVGLESEIRQILNNLISNATDAIALGSGKVYVRSRPATHWKTGREGVLFTVADTGEGMSRETKERLFKAFYTTKGTRGTGLGLWVSMDLASRNRGCLRFRSSQRPGCSGTVFQLFLPYQSAVPAAESESLPSFTIDTSPRPQSTLGLLR